MCKFYARQCSTQIVGMRLGVIRIRFRREVGGGGSYLFRSLKKAPEGRQLTKWNQGRSPVIFYLQLSFMITDNPLNSPFNSQDRSEYE